MNDPILTSSITVRETEIQVKSVYVYMYMTKLQLKYRKKDGSHEFLHKFPCKGCAMSIVIG